MRGAAAELAAQQRLQRAAEVEQRPAQPARLGPLERPLERRGRAVVVGEDIERQRVDDPSLHGGRGASAARARPTTRRDLARAASASPSASCSWASTTAAGSEPCTVRRAAEQPRRPARAPPAQPGAPPRARRTGRGSTGSSGQSPSSSAPASRTASALSSSPCRSSTAARSSARHGAQRPLLRAGSAPTRASSSVTAASSPRSQRNSAAASAR